jgi:hypothetical protein
MYVGLSRGLISVLGSVVVVGSASYAFLAAASGLPIGTHAGAATASVSGYAVSNLSYSYDSVNPDSITEVEFTLDNGAAVVHLQLATGGAWYACSENAGLTSSAAPPDTVWDCDTTSPQATVTSQDEISVVAHS